MIRSWISEEHTRCSAERGRELPYCPICGSEYEAGVESCTDCDSPLVERPPLENPDADPDATLVEICEASGDKEAFVIRGLLESEGIWCSLGSDIPHTVLPINVDGLGTVRIFVSEKDAERAVQLISGHENNNDDS
jgi:hypothetical protein